MSEAAPKKIAVIDGNSLMHRAYHAVPPTMNAPDGTPTNAVFGFLSMLLKFIDLAHPDAIVCAFDVGKPEFRIKALEQYKAQRPKMDDELRVQFPLIDDVMQSMNIPVVKVPGWEGDDILGTISARCDAAGYDCLLVSGDKDVCQLASEHTKIVNTKKGITDVVIFDPAGVFEKYGVEPAQIPDYLGLMGDTADNIPGVPGIGPKTATKLLQKYGTMEGLYEHLDELKGKQLEHVRDNRDAAFLSRDVAVIKRDLDFPLDLEAISFPSFTEKAVVEEFGKLGMKAHMNKVLALVGGAEAAPVAPAAQLEWDDYATGDEALAFVDECLAAAEGGAGGRFGLSWLRQDQANLFGANIMVGFAAEDGVAVLEGDSALSTLVRMVRLSAQEGVDVAVHDAKLTIQVAYPADTAEDAQLSDDDVFASRLFDATLAAYALDSSVAEYVPNYLSETYLGGELPKGQTDADTVAIEAAALRALVEPLRSALDEDGSRDVYEKIDAPLVPVLARMERTGAALDVATLDELGARTQGQIDELVGRIYDLAGEEFNIDSPKQVAHILFEVLGLKPLKKTSRGYSTNAKVLTELAKDHELPGLILQYRELAKIKGTYIDALPAMRKGDGRLHGAFNETVTTTGRLSSSNPNLQNIPVRTDFGRHIRACFVPLREGDEFVGADYSQIELRLLAHLSGDEHLIHAFCTGADFHSATAARVFGIPVDQVTPELRSRAKAVNFGIVYGQQAFGLSQSLHIPFGEAQEMIDAYFQAYPGVRTYLDGVVDQATQNGYAETMFGRKRHIPELKVRNRQQRAFGERTAMNHPMQGSAADIIKIAMRQVEERLRVEYPEAHLMVQVHDELDLSVPTDQVEGVSALLKDVMEHVVELKVPLVVDVEHGPNWAEAH